MQLFGNVYFYLPWQVCGKRQEPQETPTVSSMFPVVNLRPGPSLMHPTSSEPITVLELLVMFSDLNKDSMPSIILKSHKIL